MRRRHFIALLGSAAVAWPLAARAQQPTTPAIGLLSGGTAEEDAFRISAFRLGLAEAGYADGRNVTFEYRGARGRYEALPALAAELVAARAAVIVALGPTLAALAAKGATATIPIVFYMGADPVKVGLVASLNRPAGNITGITQLFNVIVAKQFELLHDAAPNATLIGLLVNPANSNAQSDTSEAQEAAHALGQKTFVVRASSESELEAAFEALARERVGALLIPADAFLRGRVERLAALALRHRLPLLTSWRECTNAGGLISYGASQSEGHRQQGVYAGRILKGERPGDLPVVQPTRFEFVLNLKTAKELGLNVPLAMQVAADEVIE